MNRNVGTARSPMKMSPSERPEGEEEKGRDKSGRKTKGPHTRCTEEPTRKEVMLLLSREGKGHLVRSLQIVVALVKEVSYHL